MVIFESFTNIICVVFFLMTSGVVMGRIAFSAGLGAKRWALLGMIIGPAAYPLLNTHKHYAWRRSARHSTHSIRF